MGTRASPYSVETRGSCLMCLKLTEDVASRRLGGFNPSLLSSVYSLGRLSSYLKLDFQRIFNITPNNGFSMEHPEVMAPLCRSCATQSNLFIQLHNELERIQNRVSQSVQTMTRTMVEADQDPRRKWEYQQRLTSSNPLEIIQSSIAEKLRRELIEKGSNNGNGSKKLGPSSVKMLERRGVTVKPIIPVLRGAGGPGPPRRPFSFPEMAAVRNRNNVGGGPAVRRPGPAFNNISRPTRPIPTMLPLTTPSGRGNNMATITPMKTGSSSNNSNKVDMVELVDLDNSDNEEPAGEEEEQSELVIQSVTGANGLTLTSVPSPVTNGPVTVIDLMNTPRRPPPSVVVTNCPVPIIQPTSTSATSSPESKENDVVKQNAISEADSFLDSLFGIGSCNTSGSSPMNLLSGNVAPLSRSDILREVGKDDIYTIFDNGKCRCSVCGKMLSNHNPTKESHKLIHLNKKPLKCIHCPAQFRNMSNLKGHILGFHRAEMLESFRKPEVGPEVFKNIVRKFFRGLEKAQGGDELRPWLCNYCKKCYKGRADMEAHLIQLHSDDVGKELQQLQENISEVDMISITDGNYILPSLDGVENGVSQLGQGQIGTLGMGGRLPGPSSAAIGMPHPNLSIIHNKVKCQICNKICSDKMDLKRHYMLFHTVGRNNAKNTAVKGTSSSGAMTLSCPYCPIRFRFQHSIRVHVLNAHRFQVFRGYLPQGTSDQRINDEVNAILKQCKDLGNNMLGCQYCPREFSPNDLQMLQNHVLLSHFDSIVAVLQTIVGKPQTRPVKRPRRQSLSNLQNQFVPSANRANIHPRTSSSTVTTPTTSTLSSPSSSLRPIATTPAMKMEEDDDIIEILPD